MLDIEINLLVLAGKPAIFGFIGLVVGWHMFKRRTYLAIICALLFALASFAFPNF